MRSLSLDRTGLCSPSGVDAFALTDSNSALGNNGPFAAEQSRGTNRHTGEQMTHWDMLKKATKFEFSFFNMSQCVICSPVWRFCTTWLLSCNRPIGFVSTGARFSNVPKLFGSYKSLYTFNKSIFQVLKLGSYFAFPHIGNILKEQLFTANGS